MANKRGLGWLSRGALLAVAALFVPACGGGGGIAQLPSLYIGTNLRGTARAVAKDLALGYMPPLESLAALMTAAKLNFTTGSESGYWATAADAAAAYNVMGTGVQNRSLG